MGKHKKDKKKHKKKKYSSDSDSSEEEWVEKKSYSTSSSDEEKLKRKSNLSQSEDKSEILEKKFKEDQHRSEWMSFESAFSTSSNSERRLRREEQKKLDRKKQQYDPRECDRELNPYWKNGGDGLPKFQKPREFNQESSSSSVHKSSSSSVYKKNNDYARKTSGWKKNPGKEGLEIRQNKTEDVQKPLEFKENEEEEEKTFTEKELNALAAKLVKAEIMGNQNLINDLKRKLESARDRKTSQPSSSNSEEVLLTRTDSQGRSQPVKLRNDYNDTDRGRKRKKNVETHKDGERVRYFADDDKYSLKQMFESEKFNSVEDQNIEFAKMAGKVRKNDDLDDFFSDNIRKKEPDAKTDSKQRDRAVSEHQKVSKSLDSCSRCIQSQSMPKHLMITMKETAYLSLTPFEPLTEGHCLIVPIRHVPCATQLDENEWSDVIDLKRSLMKLFGSRNKGVIFYESAMGLHRFPHCFIECVPLPTEEADLAPIYFKKAIDESETEWSQNKKLVSLKGRDVRKAIPKGLAYFFVSFGLDDGFAHVIEDEVLFPSNFAQEIVGGMLDIHHSKWRKPRRQNFEEQSKRVVEFSREWKDYERSES